ncbi:MAG: aminotransferase class V-fold PLP-dependent enzyme [Verrucomicrobiota bacterium]
MHPSETSHLSQPGADPSCWPLDPSVIFLNHGSFGSCPRPVLDFQQTLRERMEQQPIRFFVRDLEGLLDEARRDLGVFINAPPNDLAFVPNATAGVNTVLRSFSFNAGDELLVTNHEYNACRNALDYAAKRAGAQVVVAEIPFPLHREDEIADAIMGRVTARTRLALIDHVTSQTGLILPVARLARELSERGVDLVVDGAHAPGMVPLDLVNLGAAFYTGNCHKWICAPKGAAFLYVRPDRQQFIRPLTISHGANSPRTDRSRFQIEFGWTGTWDPTAMLSVPEALRFMETRLRGGWPEIMRRNRDLALAARQLLCRTLQIPSPCPDSLIGSLASVPLSDSTDASPAASPLYADPLQDKLRAEDSIEVPVIPWPAPPKRVLRISCQLYNALPQYEVLGESLAALLKGQPRARGSRASVR